MQRAVERLDRLFILEDALHQLTSLAAHAQGVLALATVEAENTEIESFRRRPGGLLAS